MRIKRIEDLPMASSAELYQLSWVIEQLLAEPGRIAQVRAQLHAGQKVQYFNWRDGKLRSARVVGVHADQVLVLDPAYDKALKVPYAAIHLELRSDSPEKASEPQDMAFAMPRPREVAHQSEFRVGNRVTFTDKSLQPRVGTIVRINQFTATLDCDGQKWRVAFELLRHLVDV